MGSYTPLLFLLVRRMKNIEVKPSNLMVQLVQNALRSKLKEDAICEFSSAVGSVFQTTESW